MHRPRLLICCDWFAPGNRAGGPIRSCVNLVSLLHDDFKIAVLTGDRDLGATESYPGVVAGRWNNWQGQATVWYARRDQHLRGAFLQAVHRVRPQTVYLNSMFSPLGSIIPLLTRQLERETRFVLAPRGMLKHSALEYRRWKKTPWLRFLKASGLSQRIAFHATSESEAQDIRRCFGDASQVHVVANVPAGPPQVQQTVQKRVGELRLSFLGRVHPVKNLLYVLRLLREVSFRCSLSVIGPIEDDAYYQQCQQQVQLLPDHVSVDFAGALTNGEAIQRVAESHAMVLPTLGENFGHAIYESLSVGVPVVISDQTFWRSLEHSQAGWDINLADAERFQFVLNWLGQMDQQEYAEWRLGARGRAESFLLDNNLQQAYRDMLSTSAAFVT